MPNPKWNTYSGKYCCLPGCSSASSNQIKLYQVPNGKRRYGVSTAEWSECFQQVSIDINLINKFAMWLI